MVLMFLLPPSYKLFPYTTLFRSTLNAAALPTAALTGLTAGALGAHERMADLVDALALEAASVGRAAGFEIGRATSELQSHSDLVCRLLLEKKKTNKTELIMPDIR